MTTNSDPDGLECYSDHKHDIQTVGECTMCGSTDVDHVGHILPQVERLKGIDPVKASAIVVNTQSLKIVDGILLDYFTAQAIQAVHNALQTDEARARLRSMTLPKAADVCFRLINNNRSTS